MKYLKSKDITKKHIEKVNKKFGWNKKHRYLTNYGYAFYYNQLFINNLSNFDVHRYANLNTIFGYQLDFDDFVKLETYFWKEGIDTLEFNGCKKDKKFIKYIAKELGIDLDFSKWQNLKKVRCYGYSYFEDGIEYK